MYSSAIYTHLGMHVPFLLVFWVAGWGMGMWTTKSGEHQNKEVKGKDSKENHDLNHFTRIVRNHRIRSWIFPMQNRRIFRYIPSQAHRAQSLEKNENVNDNINYLR
eukprot:Lithocolla_globosa_v1_NODE_5496_length_1230_cov_72.498723.p2 type:complete len:106 gc:universal NODE_5496_length_1230_cov_72.498723:1091-774(-)